MSNAKNNGNICKKYSNNTLLFAVICDSAGMIIDFSVGNFRSIRDLKNLSLLAYNRKNDDLCENKIDYTVRGFKNSVLKGAVVYGGNASGKSNLLMGVAAFLNFALHSFQEIKPEEQIPIEPFLLDETSRNRESVFEINFIVDEIRYSYRLELNRTRITHESLASYPKGISRNLFTRKYTGGSGNYSFEKSVYFKADFDLFYKVRDNVSYLSYALASNVDALMPLYRYLSSIEFISGVKPFQSATELKLFNNEPSSPKIKDFIKSADLGIRDIQVKKNPLSKEQILGIYGSKSSLYDENNPNHPFNLDVDFAHRGYEDKEYTIPLQNESDGTRKIFRLIGPLIDIIAKGGTLFIDEIDTSLHPLMVKELLKLFFSEKNTKGAQIVFTSHNPILLDANLLRRDQVWFSAKNDFGETDLYPLLDYSPRKGESLIRGYLGGRYGAIPFFESIEKSMDFRQ